jgi:hypothetical protein
MPNLSAPDPDAPLNIPAAEQLTLAQVAAVLSWWQRQGDGRTVASVYRKPEGRFTLRLVGEQPDGSPRCVWSSTAAEGCENDGYGPDDSDVRALAAAHLLWNVFSVEECRALLGTEAPADAEQPGLPYS